MTNENTNANATTSTNENFKTGRSEMYNATILATNLTLSARDRLRYKETANHIKINDVITESSSLVIAPKGYVVLGVHNEKAQDDKDYRQYIIVAEDGNSYITGSETLFEDLTDIMYEMESEAQDEPYEVEIKAMPSKNYKGKTFFKCTIV